jgi:hypothetical protein
MIALLKNRSRDLENVVAHSQPSYAHPVGSLPAGVSFASNNSFSSGPSFFERLFGPPTPPAAIPGRRQMRRAVPH